LRRPIEDRWLANLLPRDVPLLEINCEEPVKYIQIPALKSGNAGICILPTKGRFGE